MIKKIISAFGGSSDKQNNEKKASSTQKVPTFNAGSFSAEKPTKIEILGTGCTKCLALEKVVQDVVATMDGMFEVVKVEDIQEIMAYQVMSTPGLVIDGVVKSTGKLLTQEEVRTLLV
jgi:small redox-active disulfide protein 2